MDKRQMDVIDFFIGLGRASEEMQKQMTIEEAVDIIDPNKMIDLPGDPYKAMACEIKARIMVSEYVRKNLDKETKNGR